MDECVKMHKTFSVNFVKMPSSGPEALSPMHPTPNRANWVGLPAGPPFGIQFPCDSELLQDRF
jgi:hypothetical protein